jgi:hypothetical protein
MKQNQGALEDAIDSFKQRISALDNTIISLAQQNS